MFDIPIVFKYLPLLFDAAATTVALTLLATVIGLVIGLAAALGRLSRHRVLRDATSAYIWLIRSTPLLVQLFIIYFGLPQFGIELSPFTSGVIGLALNVGAYNAETIRAGILAIPRGQIEASRSLGFGAARTMRAGVLPAPLTVTPARVAADIYAAAEESPRDVIYVGRRFWLVMTIIGLIPEALFKRLKL